MRISFAGDIMCEKPFMKELKKSNPQNLKASVFDIKQYYSSDYVVANLETVFAGKRKGYTKDIYSFNSPDVFCELLKYASIDCVSTANNHCLDRGIDGLKRTIHVLDENNIKHIGTSIGDKPNSAYSIIDVKGVKIALLAYTYGTNYSINKYRLGFYNPYVNLLKPNDINAILPSGAINYLKERLLSKEIRVRIKRALKRQYNSVRVDTIQDGDIRDHYLDKLKTDIKEAKKNADLVAVYLHVGGQFNKHPGTYSKAIFDFFYRQDVDIIVGGHPHVIQEIKNKKNNIITYSLGNFFFSPNSIYVLYENKPDYSIVLHVDISESLIKYSFSIVNILVVNGKTMVRDTQELYIKADSEGKRKLLSDCKWVFTTVTGVVCDDFKIKKEYNLLECKR